MEPAGGCVLISCAAGSHVNAHEIAAVLVSERVVACVHVMPVESHYHWQGALHHEPEFLIQAKTTIGQVAAAEALIKRLHTYELPGIDVVPITGGSAEYLAWIAESVGPAGTRCTDPDCGRNDPKLA